MWRMSPFEGGPNRYTCKGGSKSHFMPLRPLAHMYCIAEGDAIEGVED